MFKNLQETISRVFASQKVDDENLILFEDTLIQADIDIETSEKIINELKSSRFSEQVSIEDIQNKVIEIISKILKNAEAKYEFKLSEKIKVILFIGVNGTGKTTTIAKFAKKFKDNDNSILLVAGDTFRAAATEQLGVWADRLNIQILKYDDSDLFISRSGYTGEDGFEISISNNKAEKLIIDILNKNNVMLCGLGCRDSLRVEAGLSLYGNEINENINPVQAGLSWALDKKRLQDNNLNGSEILSKELSSVPSIKKIGLSPVNKIMLRNQMTIHNNNKEEIGFITSGCYSPILKKSIGIGYINKLSNISEKKYVNVRDKYEEIKLEKIPFVKKNYKKGD